MLMGLVSVVGCAPKKIMVGQPPRPASGPTLLSRLPAKGSKAIPCRGLAGAVQVLLLPDGQLYFRAGMEIDADGSPRAKLLDPLYGQSRTSLQYSGLTGQDRFLDAEKIPYIVLPGGFAEQFGIEVGDLAAVFFHHTLVFAVYADVGPAGKLGEGSIRLAELCGHQPWKNWSGDESFSTHGGIPAGDVEYLVFPGSRLPDLRPSTIVDAINQRGAELLAETCKP